MKRTTPLKMIRTKFPGIGETSWVVTPDFSTTRMWSQNQIAYAIRKSGGILSDAARILKAATGRGNPNAHSIKTYIERDPVLAQVWKETKEYIKDVSESAILRRIKDDSHPDQFNASKFYLQTQGKDRGWTYRNELTGADGKPVEVTPVPRIDLTKYTDHELLQLEALLNKGMADDRPDTTHHNGSGNGTIEGTYHRTNGVG